MAMHYKLPLDISRFFSDTGEGMLEQCNELESIDHYLGAVLATHPGEHSFSREFGTKLWEMDFENVASKSVWERMFLEHILAAVRTHEKRIKDVEIKIDIKDVVREDTVARSMNVRKRIDIFILGTLVSTNKPCGFKHTLFVGPLSRD
jgi:phage baseplate assembly protein W